MGSPKSTNSAIVLFLLSLSLTISFAFAASGGRMGGDAFSDRSNSPPSTNDDHYHDNYYHHHHHHPDNWHRSSSNRYEDDRGSEGRKNNGVLGFIIPAGMIGAFSLVVFVGYLNNRASIIMIQVGLTGNARLLKKELNEIAKTADSSSAKG